MEKIDAGATGEDMNSKITRKQKLAIAALLQTSTVEDAAAEAGVSPRTLQRWRTLDEFKAAYAEAESEILKETLTLLTRASRVAAAMIEICRDRDAPATARVSAARGIFENIFKAQELMILRQDLDELKAIIAGRIVGTGPELIPDDSSGTLELEAVVERMRCGD